MNEGTTRVAAAAGLLVGLLVASGCGADGGSPAGPATGAPSTASATPAATVPPPDPGPRCDGDQEAKGPHVLPHASVPLPGGTSVTYAAGHADGTRRTAELTVGTARQTVRAGQRVTLAGHPYTVAQVCTYRVVLTGPGLHAPAPWGTGENGESMAKWPTTYDGVLPLRWHVPINGPEASIVVTDIQDDPRTCTITTTANGKASGWYKDLRQGDEIEFAGRLWRVEEISAGNMGVPEASRDFSPGKVRLQELGNA